jgi:hypothetical protein
MSCFPNEVLIHRRVRRREPALNLPSQLFACGITSISETKRSGETTNVSSCLFRLTFGEERLPPQVSTAGTELMRRTYPDPVEYYPMTPFHLTGRVQILRMIPVKNHAGSRTFQNRLHVTHKTMNHTQCLCNSYSSLVLRQSIQSLKDRLDFALPQQFFCEFL